MGKTAKAVLTLLGFKEVDGKWVITIDDEHFEAEIEMGYSLRELIVYEKFDENSYGDAMTLGEFIVYFYD